MSQAAHQPRREVSGPSRQALKEGADEALSNRQNFLEEVLHSELHEPDDRGLLSNLDAKNFKLANYSEAEKTELRWDLEVIYDAYRWMHPGSQCVVTGDFRAYCFDDPESTEQSLTDTELLQTLQYMKGIQADQTRGENMKQQDTAVKSVMEQRRVDDTGSSRSGIMGKLSR